LRAALYLRVSTARQAEHDVSIPDQAQGEAYCERAAISLSKPSSNHRRPTTAARIPAHDRGRHVEAAPFDVVVVHSFSRFFRDHFELEFYVRKLAKNGVKLVSITQEWATIPCTS
jgi:DNA invertase Pin-like site-specific DNA recombinase